MGTDRLISDRNGNQEKALELDRAHSEEADVTGQALIWTKEEGAIKEHLVPGFRGDQGSGISWD